MDDADDCFAFLICLEMDRIRVVFFRFVPIFSKTTSDVEVFDDVDGGSGRFCRIFRYVTKSFLPVLQSFIVFKHTVIHHLIPFFQFFFFTFQIRRL